MNPKLTIQDESHALVVTVEFDRWDAGSDWNRAYFNYTINADGVEVTGSDLGVPSGRTGDALESLLSFLSAFAEAARYPDSDNRSLFPESLLPWAEAVDPDYIALLREEVLTREPQTSES